MERARPLARPAGPLAQERPLVAAQSTRAPVDPPVRHPARGPAREPPPLPRLPAARGTAAALPRARRHARASPPRRLAGLGRPLPPPPPSCAPPAPQQAAQPRAPAARPPDAAA